jgi:hypothetical protein
MRSRIALVVSVMLVVGLVAGLATSASGAGDPGATVAKKKKKVCPAGTHKVTVKKKNGKKKKKCVADPTTPAPPASTTLTISPTTFTYPDTQHHTGACDPAVCPTQAFTVTNTGGAASGVPASSITEVTQPVIGAHDPGYFTTANTCTAPLSAGGSCSVTVQFIPPSNAGDGNYTSVLHVVATPGSDVQAALSGHAD